MMGGLRPLLNLFAPDVLVPGQAKQVSQVAGINMFLRTMR